MSRIHDALRRGRAPAGMPKTGRTARADAVLAALGYKSDKPRATLAALRIIGMVVCWLLVVAWFVLPPWRELFPTRDVMREAGGARREAGGAVGVEPTAVKTSPAGTLAPLAPEPNSAAVSVPAAAPTPNVPAASAQSTSLPAKGGSYTVGSGDSAPALSEPAKKPESKVTPPPVVSAPPAAKPAAPPALPATNTPAPVANTMPQQSNSALATVRPEDPPRASRLAPRAPASSAPDEFQLALYYQRSGDFEKALMSYRAALERDEMNVEAHNNLGHLYLGKGLFENAVREFERVVAIDPKYTTARINLSAAYYSLGLFDRSAAEARIALEQQARNPDALVNLALAQSALGQTGDSHTSLRRALEKDPRNAAAHYNLARQFEAAGEASAAIDHYNKFIQYASPEQTAYAAGVRARLAVLAARIK